MMNWLRFVAWVGMLVQESLLNFHPVANLIFATDLEVICKNWSAKNVNTTLQKVNKLR